MKKLLLLSFLAFAACKKTDSGPSLPGPSSNGQNYLAFKVNGAIRIYGASDYLGRNGVVYNRYLTKTGIAGNDIGRNDALGLRLPIKADSIVVNRTYTFGTEAGSEAGYTRYNSSNAPDTDYFTTLGSGWVRFARIDTAVAAGTFAFTAYLNGVQGTDSVVITEGRFDIPWK